MSAERPRAGHGSEPTPPSAAPGGPDVIPAPYVTERVRDALAADDRVGELGLSVEIRAVDLVVRGTVSTATRKAGIVPVVREVLDGLGLTLAVDDRTEVPPATGAREEAVG